MHACHSVKQDQWEGYKQLGLLFRINQSSPSLRPFPYYSKPLFHPWMELHTRHKVVSAAPIALGLNSLRTFLESFGHLHKILDFGKVTLFMSKASNFLSKSNQLTSIYFPSFQLAVCISFIANHKSPNGWVIKVFWYWPIWVYTDCLQLRVPSSNTFSVIKST